MLLSNTRNKQKNSSTSYKRLKHVTKCWPVAHPAKFPDAVEKAIGRRPALPPRLSDLYEREEAMTVLPNDLAQVQDFVRDGPFPAAAA